jgi:hypothetical protein
MLEVGFILVVCEALEDILKVVEFDRGEAFRLEVGSLSSITVSPEAYESLD